MNARRPTYDSTRTAIFSFVEKGDTDPTELDRLLSDFEASALVTHADGLAEVGYADAAEALKYVARGIRPRKQSRNTAEAGGR